MVTTIQAAHKVAGKQACTKCYGDDIKTSGDFCPGITGPELGVL